MMAYWIMIQQIMVQRGPSSGGLDVALADNRRINARIAAGYALAVLRYGYAQSLWNIIGGYLTDTIKTKDSVVIHNCHLRRLSSQWRRRKIMTLETLIPLKARTGIAAVAFAAVMMPLPAAADPFFFSTGNPDGRMATAARPESAGKFEIETGDDFALTAQTSITGATFTGLLTGGSTATIGQVVVEIYRVFPNEF